MLRRSAISLAAIYLFIALSFTGFSVTATAQDNVMTPELLWKLGRLGEAAIAEDGSALAWTVRTFELAENRGQSALFLSGPEGQDAKAVLEGWRMIADLHWQVSDAGESIFFTGIGPRKPANDAGNAEATAPAAEDPFESSPQIYCLSTGSGEVKRISSVEDGVANVKFSPDGKFVAFTRDVKLDNEVKDLFPDLPLADARIIDSLMYRHWDSWHDFKYSHLHVAKFGEDGQVGAAMDLMEGMANDCPVPPFGGSEQFAWSPDSRQICYTTKIAARWAESTDSDLYLVSLNDDGSLKGPAVCITEGRDGYDNNPAWSPDGRYIAFNSMTTPGFEADRNRIMLYPTSGEPKLVELTNGLDQNANHFIWTSDSSAVIFVSEHRGCDHLFQLDLANRSLEQLTEGWFDWDIIDEVPGADRLLVKKMSMIRPLEIYSLSMQDRSERKISAINDRHFEGLQVPTVSERWIVASDGQQIHNWVIYPPGFDEKKKYPLLVYCQGGPQGQVSQFFSYRWNFHLMAANGYVVVAPNRRGLPGFGRAWNDQISGDWGGQAMRDILSAADNMLGESFIDRERAGAVGASFGGYTVYWLMGNAQERFKAMIAHCGVYNLESMYGSTEELFFVNYDLGGPYWRSQELQRKYNQFSPHRFAQNWKTPLLVIHGEKDFRVPVTQGMEAFTAAQVQGVPSRFLYFPEEGHWVNGPQNGVLWHRVFFDWLGRYLK